ncbi:hypothetical protein BDQ17DRAFT_348710 [Cyathus striatus]|nr:hypothetical protein BDQ17DRAFT_348710 [Cyathus striatus]
MASSYTISPQAYFKVFFHAAKHPHKPVNGVLLGNADDTGAVIIEDAIPLLHQWTGLSPMMEIGLDLAGQHAEANDMKLVGYYQAGERLDDAALAPVGEKVAEKVRAGFRDAVAFVIDGEQIGTDSAALIPYVPQASSSASWRPHSSNVQPFSPGSIFQLFSNDLPSRAVALVRDDYSHNSFGDFDDHLEDVSVDWLRNRTCLPADI